jgi:hypothetical protein
MSTTESDSDDGIAMRIDDIRMTPDQPPRAYLLDVVRYTKGCGLEDAQECVRDLQECHVEFFRALQTYQFPGEGSSCPFVVDWVQGSELMMMLPGKSVVELQLAATTFLSRLFVVEPPTVDDLEKEGLSDEVEAAPRHTAELEAASYHDQMIVVKGGYELEIATYDEIVTTRQKNVAANKKDIATHNENIAIRQKNIATHHESIAAHHENIAASRSGTKRVHQQMFVDLAENTTKLIRLAREDFDIDLTFAETDEERQELRADYKHRARVIREESDHSRAGINATILMGDAEIRKTGEDANRLTNSVNMRAAAEKNKMAAVEEEKGIVMREAMCEVRRVAQKKVIDGEKKEEEAARQLGYKLAKEKKNEEKIKTDAAKKLAKEEKKKQTVRDNIAHRQWTKDEKRKEACSRFRN